MNKWITPLVITVCVLLAILFRVILPFGNVFNEDGVNYNTVDAYLFIRYAEMPTIPDYDFYNNYPKGNFIPHQMLFPQLIQATSNLFMIDVQTAGAWLPPLLFLFSLIPFYFMVRKLFNNKVALISLALVCVLPGQLLHRTMLGAADHHCLEIFLFVMICAYLVYFVKDKEIKLKVFDGIVLLGLVYLYFQTWAGGLLVLGIVILIMCGFAFKVNKYAGIITSAVCGAFITITYFYHPTAFKAFIININETVAEELPLLFAGGKFDMTVIWGEYSVGFFVALIGLGILIYQYIKHKDIGILAFLSITAIILAMAIAKRRFTYYLSYEVAVLIAYTVYFFYQNVFKRKENRIKLVIVCFLIFSIPLIRNSVDLSLSKHGYITKSWIETTDYLKQYGSDEYYSGSKPNIGVLSWWDYGYWIIQRSRLPVIASPGSSDRIQAAKFLTSYDDESVLSQLDKSGLHYIVIDKQMVTRKFPLIVDYVPNRIEHTYNEYLMVRLYFDENVKGFSKVFESRDSEVKVFKVGY